MRRNDAVKTSEAIAFLAVAIAKTPHHASPRPIQPSEAIQRLIASTPDKYSDPFHVADEIPPFNHYVQTLSAFKRYARPRPIYTNKREA
jgi:hypothetical protein